MKNYLHSQNRFTKLWRLFFVMLLITIVSPSTHANNRVDRLAQLITEKRVTLDCTKEGIRKILTEIKKQSGIGFAVNNTKTESDLNSLSIAVNNVTVKEALSILLKGSNYDYQIIENHIVIKPKPQTATQKQQPVKIKGKVADEENKQPIVGATLIIMGTTKGSISDDKGQFSLEAKIGDKIEVTLMGYKPFIYEVVSEESNLVLSIVREIMEVNDVVVTGIFRKAKESYTGAATTISSKELSNFKGQNLVATLRNIDPAINLLMDNNVGSNPNALPQINMRGNSSLPMNVQEFNEGIKQQINTPLIIMDGFEISLQKLMDYNDDEIETITILKDAAATAIYGSRSANGVIVITSKAPKEGKLRINFQAGMNIEIPDLTSYNLTNAAEKLDFENKLKMYNSTTDPMKDLALQSQYYSRLNDVLNGVDTYWLSKPLHVGVGQKYNLRLEGGSEAFRWGTSFSYNNTIGVMRGSKKNTFNGSITLSYTYKNIIFKNQTNVGLNKGYESQYGSFKDYSNMNPYFKPYDEKGRIPKYYYNIGESEQIRNPLYNSQLNVRDETNYTELINNFSVEWNIIDALKVRAQLGISKKTNMSDQFYPSDHTKFLEPAYQGDGYFRKGSYNYGIGEIFKYDANVTLSYSKTFNEKHQLYAGFDYSIGQSDSYNYKFTLEGFSNENLDFIGNALQYEQNGKPYGQENLTRRIGFTTNVNYTFCNRYFIDLSLRADGSSQFGSKNKFAPFWSSGIGWNLHHEKFLKESKVVNNLRLKASYGQTGSQQFNAYQALSTFQYITGEKYINWGGAELMGHGNENLKWQVTDNFNIGTEIGLFANRISAEFDFYNKKTSNLLSNMDIPLATGFGYYIDNVGEVKNVGFEAGLKGYVIRNSASNFSWLIGGKLAYNKNEITKLSEAIKAQNEIYKQQDVDVSKLFEEGRPQNAIYAVRSFGIDPSSGEEVFLNSRGVITNQWHPSDKIYLGSEEPLFRGNLSTLITYKNLSLNLSFGFHWGGMLYNSTLLNRIEVQQSQIGKNNLDKRAYEDRWIKAGDIARYKKVSNVRTRATSRFVMRDNAFELQSASLQYRWNSKVLEKAKIEAINFSLNMSDIFYFSTVKQERGLDYPFARRVGLTIALLF